MRLTSLVLGSLLSTLALAAQAQDHSHDHSQAKPAADAEQHDQHGHDQPRSLDAHEHGVAMLNLVVDGKQLVFELESPAANIVGFEHIPTGEQDLATVQQARKRLEQAGALFVFSDAAECVLTEVETQSPLFAAAKTDGHDHDKAHKAGHHDAHEGHHADSESAHSDIDARFHFTCGNPEALRQIDVKLFEAFPKTEKLLLQAITPKGQQGGELTPAQSVIHL